MARKYWTYEETQLLQKWYGRTDMSVTEMARRLGRPLTLVYQKAQALGLSRPRKIWTECGKNLAQLEQAKIHRFHKGSIPANKGKKMAPEVYAKCARTMFRKGNTPGNHREVGSERINKDGYIEVKVAEPNKWRAKHRVIWEEAHGPIERGYNVQFKDGNSQNVTLENLYVISRSRQLKEQNSLMARYPKELQAVIRLRGAVKRQVTLYNNRKINKDE